MCIAVRYSCPAEDHAPQINIHVSRKIMPRDSMSMPCGRSCIASQYPCITKNHASRVNIHASRKIMLRESISMHPGKSCIATQYSCIAKDNASRVNIQASREDFIPRRNLCITRGFHASLKFVHREKISYLA